MRNRKEDLIAHYRYKAPLPLPARLPLFGSLAHFISPHFIFTPPRPYSITHSQLHPSSKIKNRSHQTDPIHSYSQRIPSLSHIRQRPPTPHPKKSKMAPHIEELRFLRTLTPPPRNPESESDSDSYDPYRSPTPENTTGVEFDPKDEVWRCTHCGWEVETVDGVQGYCRSGHRVSFFYFF